MTARVWVTAWEQRKRETVLPDERSEIRDRSQKERDSLLSDAEQG